MPYTLRCIKVGPLNLESGYIPYYRPNLYIAEKRRVKNMVKATNPTTYITKQLNRKGFLLGRNKLKEICPVKQDSKEYIEQKQKEVSGQKAL